VGYNYGAKQYDRVIKVLKYTLICASCVTTVAFLIGFFFPHQVAAAFVDTSNGAADQAMVDVVAQGLGIAMTVFPLVGFQIVAGGFFQYIGRAPLAMFLSTTRQLLFLLPLLWFVPRELGAFGVWISMPMADTASILLAIILFVLQIRTIKRMEQQQNLIKRV
jgi:Na+-driven multidrug efflux pump